MPKANMEHAVNRVRPRPPHPFPLSSARSSIPHRTYPRIHATPPVPFQGLGKTEGELERIVFEATGPKGVAILVETLTDKRTRTLTLLRTLLHRHGCVRFALRTGGNLCWIDNNNRMPFASYAMQMRPRHHRLCLLDVQASRFGRGAPRGEGRKRGWGRRGGHGDATTCPGVFFYSFFLAYAHQLCMVRDDALLHNQAC